jgi:hypothetical protein
LRSTFAALDADLVSADDDDHDTAEPRSVR